MEKKIAGLLGAVAGIATIASAQAATEPASTSPEMSRASSYADLLEPIANPVELLAADNAARTQEPSAVELAQYSPYPYNPYRYNRHHHHHHNVYYRHHHHHHHHHGGIVLPGGVVIR